MTLMAICGGQTPSFGQIISCNVKMNIRSSQIIDFSITLSSHKNSSNKNIFKKNPLHKTISFLYKN